MQGHLPLEQVASSPIEPGLKYFWGCDVFGKILVMGSSTSLQFLKCQLPETQRTEPGVSFGVAGPSPEPQLLWAAEAGTAPKAAAVGNYPTPSLLLIPARVWRTEVAESSFLLPESSE